MPQHPTSFKNWGEFAEWYESVRVLMESTAYRSRVLTYGPTAGRLALEAFAYLGEIIESASLGSREAASHLVETERSDEESAI